MPRVSVIIPTYNRAGLVAESVQSVLAQKSTDFEIIVVDDGSTDDTKQVIESFAESRIKYVYQNNQGAPAARNAGLAHARGEYIMFLDSDDVLTEDALRQGTQVLSDNNDVAFSFGQAYLMDESRHVFGMRKQAGQTSYIRAGTEEIRQAILNGNHIPTSTIMARRKCLSETGLFENSFRDGSEDFQFWVRLAKSYAVAYIASPLVKYRVHQTSMTQERKATDIERSNRRIFKWVFDDPELGHIFLPKKPTVFFRMYLRLADYAFGSRDMTTSRRYLLRAQRDHPQWFRRRLWLPLVLRLVKTRFPLRALDKAKMLKRYLRKLTMQSVLIQPLGKPEYEREEPASQYG